MPKIKSQPDPIDRHEPVPIVGGHKGGIKSCEDAKVLLKRACTVESNFYKDVFDNSSSIKNYMPGFLGIESEGLTNHLKLQNLTEGMSAPVIIDIKLGRRTSSFNELTKNSNYSNCDARLKVLRDRTADSIATSRHFNFRVVRHSKSDLSKRESALANPRKQILDFFPRNAKTQNVMLEDLKRIHEFVMSSEFDNYELIGSSLLIVYDEATEGSARLALIDFAHSSRKVFPHGDKGHAKYVDEYRKGFSKLVKIMEQCSNDDTVKDLNPRSKI